jgi:predicted GH43/DUF377 family glycosyl hydrolase
MRICGPATDGRSCCETADAAGLSVVMRFGQAVILSVLLVGSGSFVSAGDSRFAVLRPQDLVNGNADDTSWITQNVPLFESSDRELQEVYYYRWHVYRRHIKPTPDGYVITEFLPDVPWAERYNTISCAAGHHFYEGRWIRDPKYLNDYATFWFREGGEPRRYSFWAADAMWARYLVNGDRSFVVGLLPDLVRNYQAWEHDHLDPNGLYWQIDDRDGMEYSIGGSGYRPTINSYQYGDAVAIAKIARLAGRDDLANEFQEKADKLKSLVEEKLWDKDAQFFKTLPRSSEQLVGVREEVGFIPWYFNLPDSGFEAAWKQLMDPQGFYAPFGPTTAERRSPRFNFTANHDCLWNGPSWPYATTQTLVAMANLLNNYKQNFVAKSDYLTVLRNYAKSQHKDGNPWIAEDLDAVTGKWIVDLPRSVDYNHSGYCDLIITGLVGLRPRADDTLEVNPLVPEDALHYFALDGVPYHGHTVTILYDKTGDRYHRGRGFIVFADGKEIARNPNLDKTTAPLAGREPSDSVAGLGRDTSSGWTKYPNNPVLGGKLGTCFDVSLLKENATYQMYFSWRPKRSVALVESSDGIHWSDPPVIVLSPNDKTDWEQDINRPVVVKKSDGYHMWYTGQARGRSWIGYATSGDGKTWTRQSDKPVLWPDQPWEKVALMCPHVIWDEGGKQFRMWYSGGEQYEPDAIGYATSPDGLHWAKRQDNPIFKSDPSREWERHKVTACQVVRHDGWFYMFYIGFRDVDHAQIGLARSKDGITDWQRLPSNPIISPGKAAWDADACYKPYAIFDPKSARWMLWYNGRRGGVEQIGLAIHEGQELWEAK